MRNPRYVRARYKGEEIAFSRDGEMVTMKRDDTDKVPFGVYERHQADFEIRDYPISSGPVPHQTTQMSPLEALTRQWDLDMPPDRYIRLFQSKNPSPQTAARLKLAHKIVDESS